MHMEEIPKKEKIVLAVLLLSVSIIPLLNAGFDNHVTCYLLILLCGTSIYNAKNDNKKEYLNYKNTFFWLVLFVLWGALSIIWSISAIRTIIEFIQLTSCVIVYYLIKKIDNDNKLRVIRIAVITGTLIALLGIIQYIFVKPEMIVGTFPHHNPFGIYLSMLFITVWGYNLKNNSKENWLISLILMIALLLSASRGAIICTAIALPFILICTEKKDLLKQVSKTIICLMIGIALTYAVITCATIIQNYKKTGAINININSQVSINANNLVRAQDFETSAVGGRLEFWRVAYKLWLNKPVNGYGLGSYFSAYYIEYGGNNWYSRFAHNYYLQTAAELGIIGVILLLSFFLVCLIKIIKGIKNGSNSEFLPFTFAACLAFILHIGIDFSWNYPGALIIFFILLGTAVGQENIGVSGKRLIVINYRIKATACILIALLTIWQMSSELLFTKAYDLSLKGNIIEANKIFELGMKFYPVNPSSYYLEGNNYIALYNINKDTKNLVKAENEIKRASKLMPYDWIYLNSLGEINLKLNNLKEAESYFKKSVLYSSYMITPYFNLTNLYLAKNRISDAQNIIIKGISLEPYAFQGLNTGEEREQTAAYFAIMHYQLANIYASQNNKIDADKNMEIFNNYIKKYLGIKK